MNGKIFGNSLVKAGFVTFALALGLAACGDGGSTNGPSNNHENTNISSVESEENLPSCTESREGFVNFINGTKEGFVCKNRRWDHYDMIADVEENLPGCTGSREGLDAYLYEEDRELNCVEGSWDVVGEVASSSSSVILSDSEGSSSSSAKSSSSVASSSSVTSSSSVASSSSSSVIPDSDRGSSSSKANWAYLNPNIYYGEFTDERDGQVYKTVKIGTQTWMAENLNYAYKGVKFNYDSYTSDSTSWCYENKASNCDKYGRLYTWSAVMDSAAQFNVNAGTKCGYGKTCTPNSPHRGICPEGWHVPTNEEYSTLYTYIGGSSTAGSLLKSTSGWINGGNGSDKYGFSVLPAGYRGRSGSFYAEGLNAYLWSASERSSFNARDRLFYYYNDSASQISSYKDYGRSLRCLKDSSSVTSSSSVASSSSSSVPGSSSSVIPGTDPGSSSSVVSSSSSSVIPGSSSSVIPGTDPGSSSSVASSSSAKSSSSVASSSSIKYGSLIDSRDNQVYKTVTIGTQTWMAENLNYRYVGVMYYYDARHASDSTSWCFENKASNCDKYGRLYTWSAVMDSAAQFNVNAGTKCGYGKTCTPNSPHRGICPEGWHVPTNEEYSTLYTYIGGSSTAGQKLKANTSLWYSNTGTDEYGFSVLPAGYRYWGTNGYYGTEGYYAYLWSASEYNSVLAWYQDFRYSDDDATQDNGHKYYSQSLRCLKDSRSVTSSSSVASSSSSSVIPGTDPGSPVYGTLTDSRDGQVYKTVTIGTQTWMAENLNYAYTGVKYDYSTYSDSTSWCYENKASNCDKYGRLYTWSAVMDSAAQFSVNAGTQCGYDKTCTPNSPHRGICPEGWHVPTNGEYSTLYTYIGGFSIAGSLLKSTSGWNDYKGWSGNGIDKYGFSVLPAGYRRGNGNFYDEGNYAYLWSASEGNSDGVWYQYFDYHNGYVYQYNNNKSYGLSLRCLKD